MNTRFSRRDALLLGGTGLTGLLAGCSVGGGTAEPESEPTSGSESGSGSGGSGGAGRSDSGSGGSGTADSEGTSGISPAESVVGELTDLGGFEVGVLSMGRVDRAPFGAFGLAAEDGNEFLAVDLAMKNVGDAHASMVVETFGVVQGEGSYGTFEPFADVLRPELGGAPFAPGELQRTRLHFEVPAGGSDARLRLVFALRRLPGAEFERIQPLQVDLESTAASTAEPTQSFTAGFEGFGESVTHEGVELTVGEPVFAPEVPNRTPAEGTEFVALPLSVTNGGSLPNPILVDVSPVGGLSLLDGAGNRYRGRVEFGGEVAGGEIYDPRNGIAPGETVSGVAVTEAPLETDPLYLAWTPPTPYWAGKGVEVNRYVFQVR